MTVKDKTRSRNRKQEATIGEIVGRESTVPRYMAIADHLRERIAAGELRPGDRLPSFAEMRNRYGSTVTTVERTYGVLEKEGLIERRQGVGTFVASQEPVLTGNIGFLGCAFPRRHLQVYYADLLEGVQAVLEEAGRELLLLGTGPRWNREALAKVDGVLLGNVGGAPGVISEFPSDMPYVSLLTRVEGATCVVADDQDGIRQAIQHLVVLGHRRIGCIMEKRPPMPRFRIAAYRDALQEAGITPDSRWLCPVVDLTYLPLEQRSSYMEWGYNSMRNWLRGNWAESDCTAIIVQNDTAAVGVLQALQEANIRVPHEVSVIGFDGTEVCDFSQPRLTAVEVPLAKIGTKGADLLLQQIATRHREAYSLVLPTKLRIGDSTGSAPE